MKLHIIHLLGKYSIICLYIFVQVISLTFGLNVTNNVNCSNESGDNLDEAVFRILLQLSDAITTKEVAILYDKSCPFVDDASLFRGKSIFRFHCDENLKELFEATHLAANPTVTFVVLASMKCVSELFEMAHFRDSPLGTGQGVFTFKHRWLLVTEAAHLPQIEAISGNITHITILTYSNYTGGEHGMGTTCFGEKNYTDSAKFEIYSIIFSSDGRKAQLTGTASPNKLRFHESPTNTEHLFPNLKYKLNGKMLIVTTLEKILGTKLLETNVFQMLPPFLNFTYKLVDPEDLQYGYPNASGIPFPGVFGDLALKKADITNNAMVPLESRARYIDFTEPFKYYTQDIIYYQDRKSAPAALTILLAPFHQEVWQLLIYSFMTFVLSSSLTMYVVTSVKLGDSPWTKTFYTKLPEHLYNQIWRGYATFVTQGVDRNKTSASANVQLLAWIFCGIILVNIYTASLVASLTTHKKPPPFTDLKSLVTQTEYTFGMKIGGAFYRWIETSNDPTVQAVFKKMLKFKEEGKTVFLNDWDQRLYLLKNTKYATIDQDWLGQSLKSEDCNFYTLGEGMRPANTGFGIQKNSAYNEIFSRAIKNLVEFGIVEQIKRDTFDIDTRKCSVKSYNTEPVKLKNFEGVFVTLLMCLGVALVVLSVEWVHNFLKSSFNRNTNWKENERSNVT